MKKFLFISMALLLACVAWAQNDSNDIVKVGDSMPAFTIVHDNGTQVASSSFCLLPGVRLVRRNWQQ